MEWAKYFEPVGLYYEGYIDGQELVGVLEDHKKSTCTSYGTRTSIRLKTCHENKAYSDDKENENTELENVSEAVNNVTHIPNICWCHNSYILLEICKTILEQTVGKHVVSFDGAPFSVGEKRYLEWQYGTKYYKSTEKSSMKLDLQSIHKMGCKTHIELTECVIYHECTVLSTSRFPLINKLKERLEKTGLPNLEILS